MTRKMKRNKKKSMKNKIKTKSLAKENDDLRNELSQLKNKVLRSQRRSRQVAVSSAVLSMKVPIPRFDGNIAASEKNLGVGRYGCVRLAKIISSEMIVAEKVMKENSGDQVNVEATLLFLMSGNPYFPIIFGTTKESIIMEFIGSKCGTPGKTVRALVQSDHHRDWSNIAWQIVEAFQALHGRGVLHNDIHGKNVLFHPVLQIVKVVDLGLACLISRPHIHNIVGTEKEALWDQRYPHVAYEIRKVKGQPSTTQTDTFSIGVLLCDLGSKAGNKLVYNVGKRLSVNDPTERLSLGEASTALAINSRTV